jgi:hypothetical protein
VQVSLHVLEDHIKIFVVISLLNSKQLHDVFMLRQLAQEHNLPVRPLSVRRILEGVKHLLHCNRLAVLFINRLPNYAISTLPLKLRQIVTF